MSQFRPYAPNDKDWVVEQYKKKHGDDWGKDLVELMEGDLTGKTEEQPTEISAADQERITKILQARFYTAYTEGEKQYLARMKKDEIDVEAITKFRLKKIETAEPKLYPAICEQLKNTLPQIAKIGGLTE